MEILLMKIKCVLLYSSSLFFVETYSSNQFTIEWNDWIVKIGIVGEWNHSWQGGLAYLARQSKKNRW